MNKNGPEPLVSVGGVNEGVCDEKLVVAINVGGLTSLYPVDRDNVPSRRRLVNNIDFHGQSICARAL